MPSPQSSYYLILIGRSFSGIGMGAATLHSRLVHISTNEKAPAAMSGSLSAGEPKLILNGPLLRLKLKYVPYTNMWDKPREADDSESGLELHYLDDDTGPPSSTVAYALPLTSFDSDGIPFRIIYFLILEGVELAETETLTMKRIGFGITSTGHEWARGLLRAPVTCVEIM
jgi:hypothetical protein